MSQDVIVVGAGVAGLAAAVRVAEAGARVLVIAKGVGSTHLAAGTVDVLGHADGELVARPAEQLPAFCAAYPDHPYAVVGTDGLAPAVEWFKGRFEDGPLAPYGYVGGIEENVLLPTAVGAARPSAVVPRTMAAGDLRGGARGAGGAGGADGAGAMLVVGFRVLKDFHPALVADNLSAGTHVQARAAELDLPASGRRDLNALALARRFDDPAFRREVVAQLAGRLGAGERVAFPAVLGIADPHGAWADLEHGLARPVLEIPTPPPSVPGMRVWATLRDALHRARGRMILNNEVVGPLLDGGRLAGVRVRVGLREESYRAAQVVLATGGFSSGGIELDSRWRARERALGLPVAGLPEPGRPRFTERYFDEQPLSRAGIAVDGELRPLGPDGEPVHANVRVAGASLAGMAPWREGCGEGVSLLTGHRAAELALAELGAVSEAPA